MISDPLEAIQSDNQDSLRDLGAYGSHCAAFLSIFFRRCEAGILRLNPVRAEFTFLIALVACSFLIRIWGISHVHVWDENVYLLNADLIRTGTAPYDEISSRPPLLSLLFAAAMTVWNSDYSAWVVAAMLNALGPFFLYLAGRLFVGRFPAFLAALMTGFTPYLANAFNSRSPYYAGDNTGHSLMTDCPALTMILISFWLILLALRKPSNWRFLFAGVSMAAAVLMRFGSLSSIFVLMLLPLAAKPPLRSTLSCAAGFSFGMAPYLCWSRLHFGSYLYTFVDGWNNFDGPAESSLYFVQRAPWIFSWFAVAGFLVWVCVTMSALWMGGMSSPRVGGDRSISLSSNSRQTYLIFWMVSLVVFFSSLLHKEPRYFLPVSIPFYLLSAVGWTTLFQTPRIFARATAFILLLLAMVSCFWTDRERFSTAFVVHEENEEMAVSSYISKHFGAGTILYAASSYPDFAYYSGRKTIPLPPSGSDVYSAIQDVPCGSIVIAYKRYADGMPAEPKLSWLEANPEFKKVGDFENIALFEREREISADASSPKLPRCYGGPQ